jgi:uncharacterized protein (TIGR00251 family)
MSIIQVKVRPGAHESVLAMLPDGSFTASLKSPPVDGKANVELVALVARHYGVPKGAVTLRSGARGRVKRVEVADQSPANPASRGHGRTRLRP